MTMLRPNPVAIVVGGGIVGACCAYYLARGGARVVVLEAGRVAEGATALASGAFRSQFPWRVESRLTMRSRTLWRDFEAEHDADLGFKEVGYLSVAASPEGATALQDRLRFQREVGMRVEELSPADASALLPGVYAADLQAAVFTSEDGYADPPYVTHRIMSAAREAGAELRQNTRVVDIGTAHGRVSSVSTEAGDTIDCDVVVNAASHAAPRLAAIVGLHLPVAVSRQHQFLTEPITWLDTTRLPNFVDIDTELYLRGEGDSILLGIASEEECGRTDLEVTWSLLEPLGEILAHRWPALVDAGVRRGWVGPYEVSPDRRGMVGAAEDPAGYFYAAGFSGHGFMHALAVGESLTHRILHGRWGPVDLSELSAARFATDVPPPN